MLCSLEAEYYSTAINGYGLNATTLGSGPQAVGGVKANLSPDLTKIVTELANDEINHVSVLQHPHSVTASDNRIAVLNINALHIHASACGPSFFLHQRTAR